MKRLTKLIAPVLYVGAAIGFGAPSAEQPERPAVDADGTVHLPGFAVPPSNYMSAEAKRRFIERAFNPPLRNMASASSIVTQRELFDNWIRPIVERAKTFYPVNIETRKIGGVRVHIITPKGGISAGNSARVLINLHGGAFVFGGPLYGLAESIPVSAAGKFRVIAVDYRMAPEYRFPAASEDVAAVYRELLKEYRPKSIGIYGCSAGGTLSAMGVAWFQKRSCQCQGR